MKKQTIIIWALVIAIIAVWGAIGILKINTKPAPPSLEVIPYEHIGYSFEYFDNKISKIDAKLILDLIYDIDYTYTEQDDLGEDITGRAMSNPNHIFIRKDLDLETYIVVLSHELTHLKYQTNNETFTEYTSLITLYETNIKMFQSAALNKARFIVGGNCDKKELDCGYYLLNYFGGKLCN